MHFSDYGHIHMEQSKEEIYDQMAGLERENRILKRKLSRSEEGRRFLEDYKEKNAYLLRGIIADMEEAQRIAEQQNLELAHTTRELQDSNTRLQIAQRNMLQTQRQAQDANRAKSAFLANMSHEIRTPMNGVLGMARLLLDTALTHEQREYAEGIRTSAEILLKLINDILDISKIEEGKVTIQPVVFDLRALLEKVVDLLASKAQQKQLELIIHYPPHCPRRVIGDPHRLHQIMTNLVDNAIKFTHRGHILIDIEAPNPKHPSLFQIQVEDTGIGLRPKQIHHIFDKFHQADASTTRKYGGTGLGLAISRQLAELMGGTLRVQSQHRKGSKFTLQLPLEFDTREHTYLDATSSLVGLRVLLVDSNLVHANVLAEQLTSWGLRNFISPSQKMLSILYSAFCAGDPFHFVLLDHKLLQSYEQIMRTDIQQRIAYNETRFIVMSPINHRLSKVEMKEIGITRTITKPIRPSQLMDVLVEIWDIQQRKSGSHRRIDSPPAQYPSLPTERLFVLSQKLPETHVLVVEDNIINQKFAVRMLEKFGCRVAVAQNGKEALSMLEKQSYSLVFMDCQMPEMDGFEATQLIRIQEKEAGQLVDKNVIIAMTANAMQGDRERCLAAGMDDYIAKPVTPEVIRDVLEHWIFEA